jgi:predicted small metal-binding protein
MSYNIACGDVMPGCSATFEADSQEELMGMVAQHAKDDHGVEEITPDVEAAVRQAITED